MKRHFKRPKSNLAARKKQELWEGRRGKPKPPPPEAWHRWMGGHDPNRWHTKPQDSRLLKQGKRECTAALAAERAKHPGRFAVRRRAHR